MSGGQRFGGQHAERGVEFVHRADRLDARRVLRDARAVAQAGRAGVAGARDDLREAMAHAGWRGVKGGVPAASLSNGPARGKRTACYDPCGPVVWRSVVTNPYARDLDRNPANHAPLTPLSLIARTAEIWPDHPSVVHGDATLPLERDLRPQPPARLGARRARHRPGRHGRRDAREHAGDGRGALRRADDRRRAQHAEHAARRRGARVHARARPRARAPHRHRVRAGDAARARAPRRSSRW